MLNDDIMFLDKIEGLALIGQGDLAADAARLSEWLTDSERDKLLKLIRNRLVNEAERYYHG